jgi:hypothetical protein
MGIDTCCGAEDGSSEETQTAAVVVVVVAWHSALVVGSMALQVSGVRDTLTIHLM